MSNLKTKFFAWICQRFEIARLIAILRYWEKIENYIQILFTVTEAMWYTNHMNLYSFMDLHILKLEAKKGLLMALACKEEENQCEMSLGIICNKEL